MADPTNEELAERLEAIAAVIGKEASLETPPADRVEELADDEWNIRHAAARLRQPLAFRWETGGSRLQCWVGDLWLGTVVVEAFDYRIVVAGTGDNGDRFGTEAEAKAALEAHITAQVTGGGS